MTVTANNTPNLLASAPEAGFIVPTISPEVTAVQSASATSALGALKKGAKAALGENYRGMIRENRGLKLLADATVLSLAVNAGKAGASYSRIATVLGTTTQVVAMLVNETRQ